MIPWKRYVCTKATLHASAWRFIAVVGKSVHASPYHCFLLHSRNSSLQPQTALSLEEPSQAESARREVDENGEVVESGDATVEEEVSPKVCLIVVLTKPL